MTALERLTVLLVLCGCLTIAVLHGAPDQTRTALTVGGVAPINLGEHVPGVEVAATVTKGRLESVSVLDLTQKLGEPGVSRVLSERFTATVGPFVGGFEFKQRLGAWSKWTARYLAGMEYGPWQLTYLGELVSDNGNNTKLIEGRWRRDRGAVRIECAVGVETYTQGVERRAGAFEIVRFGRVLGRSR